MNIIIGFFILLLLIAISLAIGTTYRLLKPFVVQSIVYTKSACSRMLSQTIMFLRLVKEIAVQVYRENYSIVCCVVFTTFMTYYKYMYRGFENWAYPQDLFPNGKSDLTSLYIWITQIRNLNYQLYESLEFDETKKGFCYVGMWYQGFTYSIDKYHRVSIKPIEKIEGDIKLEFNRSKLRLYNALQKLDLDTCTWILQRKQLLGL